MSFKKFLLKYDQYLFFSLIEKKFKIKKEKNMDYDYLAMLGINDINQIENIEKIKEAYYRASQNRDFEINKFWTRAAYFWTFLAIIFAVYFTFITEINEESKSLVNKINNKFPYIELYIICLGVIISCAWRYIILGSKQWQENWECHIDHLEKYVTGNLQYIIFKKQNFYSVSKINLILSNLFILVWVMIMIAYFLRTNIFIDTSPKVIWNIFLPIIFTLYIILQFMFGYGRTRITEKGRFINL